MMSVRTAGPAALACAPFPPFLGLQPAWKRSAQAARVGAGERMPRMVEARGSATNWRAAAAPARMPPEGDRMGIPLIQVDAFTDKPFAGNPAAVCLLDSRRDERWMQSVAREMNLSETAFVSP